MAMATAHNRLAIKLRSSITTKLAAVLVLFAAGLLTVVGLFSYNSGRTALEAATIAELQSTANEKQSALDRWAEQRRADIAALAGLSC